MIEQNDKELSGVDIAEGNIQDKEKLSNQENTDNKNNDLENIEEDSNEKLKEENLKLKEEIEKLKQQVEELKDNWARERAEFMNYRKRIQYEILQAKNSGIEEFVKKLLSVIDNLDMVLSSKSENPEVQNFIFGVDMIRGEFLKVLNNYNIKPIVDKGDKFDPTLMEAIDVEIKEGLSAETVIEVYKKAYVKYDSENKDKYVVLRTASVKVGKPKNIDLQNTNQAQENT